MLWICFETPSVRDFRLIEGKIKNTDVFSEKNNDYLKLIKNNKGELLWVFNKFNRKYMFFGSNISEVVKEKLISLVEK